jgi:hypothetical protein
MSGAPRPPSGVGGASASLSDILTAIQSLVRAVGNLAGTYISVQGTSTLEAINAATVVRMGPGRLAVVSVTTAGSAVGTAYDDVTITSPKRALYVIPNTVGVIFVNLPCDYGLVVVPGTGQVVTVSYS